MKKTTTSKPAVKATATTKTVKLSMPNSEAVKLMASAVKDYRTGAKAIGSGADKVRQALALCDNEDQARDMLKAAIKTEYTVEGLSREKAPEAFACWNTYRRTFQREANKGEAIKKPSPVGNKGKKAEAGSLARLSLADVEKLVHNQPDTVAQCVLDEKKMVAAFAALGFKLVEI